MIDDRPVYTVGMILRWPITALACKKLGKPRNILVMITCKGQHSNWLPLEFYNTAKYAAPYMMAYHIQIT